MLVRFAYYTDESMNGQGWFIDDVSVNGFSDDFDSDYDGWTLGGWTWTTGLFDNDWMAGYVNPVYNKGEFDHLDYAYLDGVISDGNEVITSVVDTSQLNREEATVVISNRPGESPFSGDYLLLVDKGDASE